MGFILKAYKKTFFPCFFWLIYFTSLKGLFTLFGVDFGPFLGGGFWNHFIWLLFLYSLFRFRDEGGFCLQSRTISRRTLHMVVKPYNLRRNPLCRTKAQKA